MAMRRSQSKHLYLARDALLSLFIAQSVHAYGYAVDLTDQGGLGHLVFTTSKAHQINFCVAIDNSVKTRFEDSSIEAQTRSALGLWTNALTEASLKHISIFRVPCDSPKLNLMVEVIPEGATRFSAHQAVITEGERSYSRVRINTNYEYGLDGEYRRVFDFGALVDKSPKPISVERLVADASAPDVDLSQVANWARMKEQQIRMSSYPILIHEFGHSFGLCDTIDEEITATCKLDTLSVPSGTEQPESVMKSDGSMHLLDDDIAGINALYTDYAADRQFRPRR